MDAPGVHGSHAEGKKEPALGRFALAKSQGRVSAPPPHPQPPPPPQPQDFFPPVSHGSFGLHGSGAHGSEQMSGPAGSIFTPNPALLPRPVAISIAREWYVHER